nr:hypothetical protein [uncultured Prevotella sp.]
MSTFSYYLTAIPSIHYGGVRFMFYMTNSEVRYHDEDGLTSTNGGIRPVAE